MESDTIKKTGSLVELLKSSQDPKWKNYHNERTCFEAYEQIKKNLKPIVDDVERGAMCNDIKIELDKYKVEIQKIMEDNSDSKQKQIQQLLDSDPVIFLNNHGRGHIDMVLKKAGEIVSNSFGNPLSEFEIFILVCAIEIHDIGNLFGRKKSQ